jgi:hypothetical protein
MFVLQAKDRYPSWKEEGLTHKVTQQERHRGKNHENTILEGFLAKGGLALYVRILGSAGALLTQGQGCQVKKLPKMSKIPKIAIQSRQSG